MALSSGSTGWRCPLLAAIVVAIVLLVEVISGIVFPDFAGGGDRLRYSYFALALLVPAAFLLAWALQIVTRDKVRAETILETLSHGVIAIKAKDVGGPLLIQYANPGAMEMLGIENSKSSTLPPEFEETVRASLESGESFVGDCMLGHGEGQRWFRIRTALLDETVVISFVDSTLRKRNEEALRASERSQRLAARMAKIGLWSIEYPGRKLVWSDEVRRIHAVPPGYEPEVDGAIDFYPPGARERIARCVSKCENSGQSFDVELEFHDANGKQLWVRALGEAETDPQTGSLIRIVGTFQDLTETRDANLALAESRELLSVAFWGGGMSVSDWRISTGAVVFDETLLRALGYRHDEVEPNLECWNSLVHPDDILRIDEAQERYFAGHTELFEAEYRLRMKTGGYRWVLERTKIVEVTSTDNAPERLVGVIIDITNLKEAESRLAAALENEKQLSRAAQAAVEAKRDFLAMMSHEIRTPMNSILGFAEILAGSSLDPEHADYVETIRRSGESLLRIINDILDYSRIESGRLHVEDRAFKLAEVVHSVVELLMPSATSKGIELRAVLPADLPAEVSGDSGRLQQVLLNLVGNAVKFTRHGQVTVSLLRGGADTEIQFSVADTGSGIPAEQQAVIFEPFTQADASISRQHGGTGLGLAISRSLVRLMGGELHVQSAKGAGAVFSFTLPLPPAAGQPQNGDRQRPTLTSEFAKQCPLSILIAEDDRTNARLVSLLLAQLGYSPVLAYDGRAAVEAAAARPPDLILMDLRMPKMDGIEATRAIRQLERSSPGHIRSMIVALTADVLLEAQAASLDAGMDDYLTKPVSPAKIVEVIKRASSLKNHS